MQLQVYTLNGTSGGSVDLSDRIARQEPSDHAIWLDVKQYLAHQRQGTHKTKERGEVSGSTKKPWRQKGTGNARSGHKRSPLWRHGGTVFGPRPHAYTLKVNQKVKQLARRSALAHKVSEQQLSVLQSPGFGSPKTSDFRALLAKMPFKGRKVLFVTGQNDQNFYLAGRNMEKVNFARAEQLCTYDIVNAEHVVLLQDSVEILNRILG